MSDEEHSDSEFYYPDDEQEEYNTGFHQFLSNEEQPSEFYEQKNTQNSQKEIVNFMPYNKKLTNFVSFDSMGKYQTYVLLYWPRYRSGKTVRPQFDIFPYCSHSQSVSYY